jgi:Cell division protein
MEDYLRLGLLVLAVIIILLIFCEGWFRRRLNRSDDSFDVAFNADAVLGLEIPTVAPLPADSSSAQSAMPSLSTRTPQKADQITFNVNSVATPSKASHKEVLNDLLVMSVVTKPGRLFASYDLLQAIAATGMQFGEMNIFHYYQTNGLERHTLFSLASATEPGDFDLDRMGNFSCTGLTLFTQLRDVPDPQMAFELMLKAADQLVEDLDGELRSNPRLPWSDEILLQYQQKVLQFQLMNEA